MLVGRPRGLGFVYERSATDGAGRPHRLGLLQQRSAEPPLPRPPVRSALAEDLMLRSAIGLVLTSLVLAIYTALT